VIDVVAAGAAVLGLALVGVGLSLKLREPPAEEAPLTDAAAIRAAIPERSDPVERDILRMRLVVMDPASAKALCPEVEGDQARAWCADILDRAHLVPRGEGKAEGKADGKADGRPPPGAPP
jgi:hypothetical protein